MSYTREKTAELPARRPWRRTGHDGARAALIYQHKMTAAGRAIADALSAQI